jgi:hypothetical protein
MSVEEILSDVIKVYPNPTSGLINLNFNNINNINFDLFSINGKLIMSYTDFRHSQIDFSFLEKGVYFIKFYVDNKIIVKKIIKK